LGTAIAAPDQITTLAILRQQIDTFGVAADDRIFSSDRGHPVLGLGGYSFLSACLPQLGWPVTSAALAWCVVTVEPSIR
jgi:hypothetical protein